MPVVSSSSKIAFHALTREWERAVAEFNERLRDAPEGLPRRFPERPSPRWTREAGKDSGVYQEYYVAAEGDVVRGAYLLKFQDFEVNGRRETIANLQLPLSEGLVNRAHSLVGLRLLRDAVERSDRIYALGMGGLHNPLPKLLERLGWSLSLVPMRIRILRPARVLRGAPYLRKKPARRLACDVLAFSGAGWAGLTAYQTWRGRRGGSASATAAPVVEFGGWADEVWAAGAGDRAFAAIRTAAVLNHLYPPQESRFVKLCVEVGGQAAGWAVLTNEAKTNHRYFGGLRLGALVDCAARPGAEAAVVRAATKWLAARGADLVVTNQSHLAWRQALDDCGYFSAPSNFAFGCSPRLAREIGDGPDRLDRVHLNRGDGDGPINL